MLISVREFRGELKSIDQIERVTYDHPVPQMPSASTKKMTAEAFATYAAVNGQCELIDGEVFKLPPTGGEHSLQMHILN